MKTLVIYDYDVGSKIRISGNDQSLLMALEVRFPQVVTQGMPLEEAIERINADQLYAVKIEQPEPPSLRLILGEGGTHLLYDESDPWPREADEPT